MRQFERGVNALPQSNGLQRGPYSVKCMLKAGETTSVAYSIYEIESYDTTNRWYVVKQPRSYGIPQAQLLIGPGHTVEAEKVFLAAQTTDAITVAAEQYQTVAVGDDMGTQPYSYRLLVGTAGFKALSYDDMEGRCIVRPFASNGVTYYDLPIVFNDMPQTAEYTTTVSYEFVEIYTAEYTFPDAFLYFANTGDQCFVHGYRVYLSGNGTGYSNPFMFGVNQPEVALHLWNEGTSTWYESLVFGKLEAQDDIVGSSVYGIGGVFQVSNHLYLPTGYYTKSRLLFEGDIVSTPGSTLNVNFYPDWIPYTPAATIMGTDNLIRVIRGLP